MCVCVCVFGKNIDLKVIENLDSLVNLEELYIGKNKITKLEVFTLDTILKLIRQIESIFFEKVEGAFSTIK